MALDQYTYVFAIGTFFALLDAYNNGASKLLYLCITWSFPDEIDDVANAWATSVSSRSVSYRQAMIFGTIFEMLGAISMFKHSFSKAVHW